MEQHNAKSQGANHIKSLWDIPGMSLQEVEGIPREEIERLFPSDPKEMAMRPGDGCMYAGIMKRLGMPQTAKSCLEEANGNFYDCFDRIIKQAHSEAGKGNEDEGKKKMDILLKKAKRRFSFWKVLTNTVFHSHEIVLQMAKIACEESNPESAALLIAQIQARFLKGVERFRPLYSPAVEAMLIDVIVNHGKPEHAINALFYADSMSEGQLKGLMEVIISGPTSTIDKVETAKKVLAIYHRNLPKRYVETLVEWIVDHGDREDAAEILKRKNRQPMEEPLEKMLVHKQYETNY